MKKKKITVIVDYETGGLSSFTNKKMEIITIPPTSTVESLIYMLTTKYKGTFERHLESFALVIGNKIILNKSNLLNDGDWIKFIPMVVGG